MNIAQDTTTVVRVDENPKLLYADRGEDEQTEPE